MNLTFFFINSISLLYNCNNANNEINYDKYLIVWHIILILVLFLKTIIKRMYNIFWEALVNDLGHVLDRHKLKRKENPDNWSSSKV